MGSTLTCTVGGVSSLTDTVSGDTRPVSSGTADAGTGANNCSGVNVDFLVSLS